MAKLDFNRVPGQQSGYTSKAKNKNKAPLLEPGTYMASITKYERADGEKGVAIKLTFGVWKRYEGFVAFITKWIGVGYKGETGDYALKDCIDICDALKIPNVFDNEIGISPEDRENHILMKKIMIQVDRGEADYSGNKVPINKIIGFSPFGTPVQSINQVQPDPGKPQSAAYPASNPHTSAPQDPRYVTENQGNSGYGQNSQSAGNPHSYPPQNPPVEQHRPQYNATPTNNPEADYAAAFGGDDRIPF